MEKSTETHPTAGPRAPGSAGQASAASGPPARPIPASALAAEAREHALLLTGDHPEPHRLLGAHPATIHGVDGSIVRAYHPEAVGVEAILDSGERFPMQLVAKGGIFAAFVPGRRPPLTYRLRFHFGHGFQWERDDPYRFLPTLGDMDLHLFNEGTHRRLWEKLGAHRRQFWGVEGVAFAVWAPNARRVSVVGDFCRWDGRLLPMRRMGNSGVFEIFVPGVPSGALYKFEIKTREGMIRLKADPFAFSMEIPPGTRSRVITSSYVWGDAQWMEQRREVDPARRPMAIYEVHLGSWARLVEEGNRPLTYRELAERLVDHVKRLGFTHIELLPVSEHPFYGSWGYQVTAYFAPTARYGMPDDFRALVDTCHQSGIGVILDWVPAHFPKDDFALRRFDGTALYEYQDSRMAEHPEWGTLIFNYGRPEVRNFLIANALYWLDEFHVDGLRVDAVASMLYLDYGRKAGEWLPNKKGGRENLEAVDFVKALNLAVQADQPGCFTVAEESTSWAGVTHPVDRGGLGFTFKWNMGWMHDTLKYFQMDPLFRRDHQNLVTFGLMYEWSERFINPLSHDEVVHLKKSLLEKMPGDRWRKFAQLRLLLAYMFTRPGKKLLFMGTELAPHREWNHDTSLDWHLASEPFRAALVSFMTQLGRLYKERPCLWASDAEPAGFSWIDCSDNRQSIVSYVRRHEDDLLLIVLNFTPVPREGYRIGAPFPGRYVELLSSDERDFAGSEFRTLEEVRTESMPYHNQRQSILLRLPPLGALILELSAEDKPKYAAERQREAKERARLAAEAAETARLLREAQERRERLRLIPLDAEQAPKNQASLRLEAGARPKPAPPEPRTPDEPLHAAPPRLIDMGATSEPEPPAGPPQPEPPPPPPPSRKPKAPPSRKRR